MRTYKTEGIIIKRRNFGESDRILTVLTKNYGKIQVKAPGVRKITSRRSSHTELLNLTLLTLYKNPHSPLPIVTEAQALEEFLSIKNNLKRIGFAYYICELIDSLCGENQENRRVFFLARDILFKLARDAYSSSEVLQRKNESRSLELDSSRQARTIRFGSLIEYFEDELLVALGFLSRQHKPVDKRSFIENILEKKLKTRRLLPLFI